MKVKGFYLLQIFLFLFSNNLFGVNPDSIKNPKKFVNLGIFGDLSTNGEEANITANNISLSLIYGHSENLYGFSLAPFNLVDSTMVGLANRGWQWNI